MKQQQAGERGTILVVVLFLASAIAALAAISSSAVITNIRTQKSLEDETLAYNEAYAQLQVALNVVNTSAYNAENQNVELLDAVNGDHGGTAAGDRPDGETWLEDPTDITHGKIRGTDVRVYRGRDYIQRLAKLKGETEPSEVDPDGESDSYYVLETAGRAGDTVRLVSALVRENEPFSSFVFFQNRYTLGVSGKPRGLIHSNDRVSFYFPNGTYVDSVSAVNGFLYDAGATPTNTSLSSANPEATPINLEQVDFDKLKTKADIFTGIDGLDAEIKLYAPGRVRVKEYTAPHWEDVDYSWTGDVLTGYETRTVTETQSVQVGTTQEDRTRQVQTGTTTETYYVDVPVYETQQEERTRTTPVYEDQDVELSRQVPVYETQTVTRTRWVRVFVPYDTDAGGGTAIGGGGGVAGEYQWVQEEYQSEEDVIVDYKTETYTETQSVQTGTLVETYYVDVQVQTGTVQEERTRDVPVYATETYTVDVPVYEDQDVEVDRDFPVYEERTYTWTRSEFFWPTKVNESFLDLGDTANTMYIDGRVTRLYGDIQGRLTIIGNEKVRITGSVRYIDKEQDSAMVNGSDYSRPYERNPKYDGNSVLGVIARDDILFTRDMPNQSEVNATLLSSLGRVGIDGFAIDSAGEPTKDYTYGMTAAERQKEYDYNRTRYRTRRFRKDSMRRIGGLISNDRILETYIRPRSDGTAYVDSGFKRGVMKFDYNLLFNPPPNFVQVPRPVVTSVAPIYFMRNEN